MIDPYKVLGVAQNATQDEIKRAYRQKAKLYHPDLHPDDPKASQKMNELNIAYDMLQHPEKYRAQQAQSKYESNAYRNPYAGYGFQGFDPFFGGYRQNRQPFQIRQPFEMPFDSPLIRKAVQQINRSEFSAAIQVLQSINIKERNARWHYLSGIANIASGNQFQGHQEIQRAVQMDPQNPEYQQILRQIQSQQQTYQNYSTNYHTHAANPAKFCSGLCLASLCCNTFGPGVPLFCCF